MNMQNYIKRMVDSNKNIKKKEGEGMKFIPHEYQSYAITHILNNPEVGLFLDMGL